MMMKSLVAAAIVFVSASLVAAPAEAGGKCKGYDLKSAYKLGKKIGYNDAMHGYGADPTRHGDVYDAGKVGDCFTDGYGTGYQAAVDAGKFDGGRGSHEAEQQMTNSPNSNEQAYYNDGCMAGKEDAQAGQSMAYERHSDMYDSRFEPYFAKGYSYCWSKYR